MTEFTNFLWRMLWRNWTLFKRMLKSWSKSEKHGDGLHRIIYRRWEASLNELGSKWVLLHTLHPLFVFFKLPASCLFVLFFRWIGGSGNRVRSILVALAIVVRTFFLTWKARETVSDAWPSPLLLLFHVTLFYFRDKCEILAGNHLFTKWVIVIWKWDVRPLRWGEWRMGSNVKAITIKKYHLVVT